MFYVAAEGGSDWVPEAGWVWEWKVGARKREINIECIKSHQVLLLLAYGLL